MRTHLAQSSVLAALLGAGVLVAAEARASGPLEYPDNGSASFSRGGAWLAVANEPIATHYNPAGLATQPSGASVEQQLNLTNTCYDRRGPGNTPVGPNDTSAFRLADGPNAGKRVYEYRPVCGARSGFPTAIPSMSLVWRASSRIGIGVAVVPPAAYGTAAEEFPSLANGYDNNKQQTVKLPAPYRYMQLEQETLILFPTVGVGFEIFKGFRAGLGFVSGIAVINTSAVGVSSVQQPSEDALGDHMVDDSLTQVQTRDLFVPGIIGSIHWSLTPRIDVAVWTRWMDSVKSSTGDTLAILNPYNAQGQRQNVCQGTVPQTDPNSEPLLNTCGTATPNRLPGSISRFKLPLPPEVRLGVRYHHPRTGRPVITDMTVRDPLHDDVFDVEVDGSYTMNERASTVELRFRSKGGIGTATTQPTGVGLPPNADRYFGYKDSFGVRVGGQWNAIQDRFGVRAGGWLETRQQDPAYLTIAPVGAQRWGFGGGFVFRQDFIDVSLGYQRHMSSGLDNGGNGKTRPAAATGTGLEPPWNTSDDPAGLKAQDRTEFRASHTINGGHVTHSAHAFTLGGTMRF